MAIMRSSPISTWAATALEVGLEVRWVEMAHRSERGGRYNECDSRLVGSEVKVGFATRR